jgi:hypothetical protein
MFQTKVAEKIKTHIFVQEETVFTSGENSFLLTGTSDSHSPVCFIPDDALIQFGPPDDEHLLLEICRGINKYIKKECIKLVITQNRIEMHGQRNIKLPDLLCII